MSHAHQLAENVRHALLSHTAGISEVMVHVDSEPHDHSDHPSSPPVSTSELEKELIVWALEGNEADVREVSHSVFHYRKV